MATPRPRASGRLRRGLRTSAPVKVTLFHASAENRDPTIATPTRRIVWKSQLAFRQKSGEIGRYRFRVAAHEETERDQPEQGGRLGVR